MNKAIGAAMGLMLGFGSITGYYLAKWDLQSNAIANSQNAIAAPAPESKAKQVSLKPIPKRSELELKYALCTNSQPEKTLARFDDKALNDLVWKVCSENS
ncbi:hypothetical protein [Pseudanabaena minima]|uniref:hypothetical protein n=1 Tax=Pseudanabaena minima TaxID=890415 RepID=UPI003DA89DC9